MADEQIPSKQQEPTSVHPLAEAIFASGVGVTCASLRLLQSSPAGWSLAFGYFVVSIVTLLAVGRLLHGNSVRRFWTAVTGAVWIAAHLLGVYVTALWSQPLPPEDFRAGLEAFRTGALPLSPGQVGLFVAWLAGLTAASVGALKLLARLPCPSWLNYSWNPVVATSTAALLLLLWLGEYVVPPAGVLDDALSLGGQTPESQGQSSDELSWSGLFQRQVATLVRTAAKDGLGVTSVTTPHLLFVHVESFRWDLFGEELFPQTSQQLARCWQSPRHYSSGNSTSNAVFTVLSGLSPAYADGVRRQRVSPQPLRALRELGYGTHVWFPNQTLLFDHLLKGVFGQGLQVHQLEGPDRAQLDEQLVAGVLERPPTTDPRFDYLVIDSPHYDYAYPLEFERFLPTARLEVDFNPLTGEGGAFRNLNVSQAVRDGVLNRYKNSLLFVDSLLAKLLAGKLELPSSPTWVVIFGDHGEAFWDGGGPFGHRTALSDAQTRVPFLLCGAGTLSSAAAVSSHEDIFPTLFDLMGVRASSPFMSGISLFDSTVARPWALLRMPVTDREASRAYAVVTPNISVHFQMTDPPRISHVADGLGQRLPAPDGVDALVLSALGGTGLRSPALR